MKVSDILFELHSNYVNEKVIESILDEVKAHGFNPQKIDELLVKSGYDEIFVDLDESYQEKYSEKIYHRRNQLVE